MLRNPSLAFRGPSEWILPPPYCLFSFSALNEVFLSPFQFDLIILSFQKMPFTTWYILTLTFSVSLIVLLLIKSIKSFEVQTHQLYFSPVHLNVIIFQNIFKVNSVLPAGGSVLKREKGSIWIIRASKIWTQILVISYLFCFYLNSYHLKAVYYPELSTHEERNK